MRVRRFTVVCGLAVLAAGMVVAAQPAAATSPPEAAVADVMSGPFHVQFAAVRPANAPATAATGTFAASNSIAGVRLFSVAGPVTCLDVRGRRMGLFYPITSSNPPLFAQTHGGVFVTLTLNAAGKPAMLGFQPSPMSHANSCAPGLALFPVTGGTATLTP